MGAATATLKASFDVQPALNAQGQATGMDVSFAQSVLTIPVTINSRRGYSFTLVNINDNQTIAFGDITVGLIAVVSASAPVKINMSVPGAGALLYVQRWEMALPLLANSLTGLTVTALTANTIVDVSLAG